MLCNRGEGPLQPESAATGSCAATPNSSRLDTRKSDCDEKTNGRHQLQSKTAEFESAGRMRLERQLNDTEDRHSRHLVNL